MSVLAEASPAARASLASLPLVLRLALRDMRGGFRGFGIFLACIALGVAAIVGVGSVSLGLSDGLAREGRRILGGDVAFSLIHREMAPQERAWLAAQGSVSSVAGLRAMARRQEGSRPSSRSRPWEPTIRRSAKPCWIRRVRSPPRSRIATASSAWSPTRRWRCVSV